MFKHTMTKIACSLTLMTGMTFSAVIHASQSASSEAPEDKVLLSTESNPAIAAFNHKDFTKAIELLQQNINKKHQLNESYYYLARALYETKDLEKAEEMMEQALDITPNSADEHFWYGAIEGQLASDASIFTAGSYASAAEEHFNKAVEMEPKHMNALHGLVSYYLNVPSIMGGSAEKAMQFAEKIIAIDQASGLVQKLRIMQAEEETESGFKIANQLINQFPDHAAANLRAGLFFQQQKQFSTAQQAFQRASQDNNLADEKHRQHAQSALYQVGRNAFFAETEMKQKGETSQSYLQAGIAALEKYLSLKLEEGTPEKHWAQTRLAQLYLASGNSEKANKLYLAVKDANVDDDTLEDLLDEMENQLKS